MAQATVKTEQIADGAITAAKIADGAIVAAELASNSVTTAKIADDAVTSAKLDTNIAIAGTLDVAGAVVFNEGSADVDFRVESNGNANMLFVDGGNNKIGINNGSPARQIHITDTIANAGASLGLTSSDSSTSGSFGIIHFGNSTDSSLASINGIADGATDAGALLFKTEATGSAIEERMRIDSSGNVGIGVAPILPLHVKGSQEQLTISEGGARGATFDYRSSTGNLNISTNGANARSAPQFTLDLNGKVGIGTASPARELHVHKASSGATSTSDSVAVIEGDDNTELSILGGSSSILAINFGHSGDADDARISCNTTSGSENMALTVNASERVLIEGNGDVTINSSTTGVGRIGHYVNQYVTLADDASLQIQSGTIGMYQVHIYERGSGAGAIFHCDYDGTTVLVNQFVAGGAGFSTAANDGYYCLHKNDNSHSVFFQNRNGSSRTFHIMIYGAEI